jgi:phosphate uptake regulator
MPDDKCRINENHKGNIVTTVSYIVRVLKKLLIDETRKIQLTGRSSYIVSLPKQWVVALGLKRGDEVSVREQGPRELLVTSKKSEQRSETSDIAMTVDSKNESSSIARSVVALYLVGANSIRLKPKTGRLLPNHRQAVKEIVRSKLVGTEILADSPQEIQLRVLVSYPELSVDNSLRRMAAIASSMRVDSIRALKEMDLDLAKETIAIDDEVDRFSLYVIRQLKSAVRDPRVLAETGLNSPVDCLGFRLIAKSVERVADHAAKISHSVLASEEPPEPRLASRIEEMSDFSGEIFDEAIASLFKKDYQLADSVLSKAESTTEREHILLTTLARHRFAPASASQIRLIVESVRRIAEYGSDIAEVVLNLTILDYLNSNVK